MVCTGCAGIRRASSDCTQIDCSSSTWISLFAVLPSVNVMHDVAPYEDVHVAEGVENFAELPGLGIGHVETKNCNFPISILIAKAC